MDISVKKVYQLFFCYKLSFILFLYYFYQRFGRQCTYDDARLAILKAIYDTDNITPDIEGAQVSRHNFIPNDKDKVKLSNSNLIIFFQTSPN